MRGFFDPLVATRGDLLALRGAVKINAGDGAHVRAVVQGRLPYDTALTVTGSGGRAIVASCTCASAAFQLCKHAWATLRVAERSGFLGGAQHANDLAVYAAQEGTRPPELRWTVDAERTRRSGELVVQLFERGSGPEGSTGFREVTGRRRWELQKYSVRALAETNACEVRSESDFIGRLVLDEGGPFQLVVDVREAAPGTTELDWPSLTARAYLERDGEVLDLEGFFSFHGEDFVLRGARASRVLRVITTSLVKRLREGELAIPEERAASFLRQVVSLRHPEATRLPGSFRVLRDTPPIAHVHIRGHGESTRRALQASVSFDYAGVRAAWPDTSQLVVDPRRPRSIVVRGLEAERRHVGTLLAAGFRPTPRGEHPLGIPSAWLPKAVAALPPESFVVEADGVRYHPATAKMLSVASGVDWFELEATAEFGPFRVAMPALLAAAKRGDGLVRLGDGHIGVLPHEWLARLERAERLAAHPGEGERALRFGRPQVSLIDALLAGEAGGAKWSGPLTALREELREGSRLALPTELHGFDGTLRDYQRAGVAWLQWLARLGLAGCLADDMGLGKTVQVLALLADRYARRNGDEEHRPSLVVAPRSVVHNWMDEAARFAPRLRVRELTGSLAVAGARDCDLLVTTYETLRRHPHRQALAFDYIVLDEAHAIKNALSATSRAVCELASRHRLALSGTPLENHLGELAALFHFLNPGMLGPSLLRRARRGLDLDEDTAARLGRGLRPFVLRRTKGAVLKDLPPLVEQTVPCIMDPTQRVLYDRVKEHYQDRLREGGLQGGELLAALLRLRQLACHPGLVDPSLRGRQSGKLEVLFDRLAPLVASQKKAIVFSQFTSLLDLVGERCARRSWKTARLDGTTADRRAPVTDFQSDPSCSIMLVSLRAGGTGLNLTAAEYVFLLDPWWNPAVEAQAIARAHRLGQRSSVIAYRLLTSGSVEERVAELQARKRRLATSIFDATETAALGRLSLTDLEELLR